MGTHFRSGLIAGAVSAVIWMSISLWVGIPTETVGLWALVFLVLVTIVTMLVATGVSRGAQSKEVPR